MSLAIDPGWHLKLGAMIAEERLARGLTQAELATSLATRQKLISNIEIGRRRVNLFELLAIERALELTPFHLVKRAREEIGSRGE